MTFKYFAVNLVVVLNGGWKKGGESQMGNCKIRFCCTVRCLSETFWAQIVLWMGFWVVVGMCQSISAPKSY